ncbi:MAG: LPS assembly protein LptD [Caulobacteraceae bacterium]
MAGAALAAVAASAAWADPAPSVPPAASPAPAASATATATPAAKSQVVQPDGLRDGGFYLEADTVSQDDPNKTVTATGHVEVRYRGRTLRSQTLVYQTQTGVVTATGGVTIVNEDGTAEFAKEVTLDDDFRTGVALGFSARLKANVKLAADSLIRRSADLTELNRAIYTPCDICNAQGQNKRPTWSIRAAKVVQDSKKHVIYYQHAVIQVFGAPVLYAPLFWHPDGQATASQSGFLAPQMQISKKRGFSYEQPYLFAISKSADLVVSPVISTKVNPFLNLDWRERFYSGAIDARFGYTYEREFGNNGDPLVDPTTGKISDLTSRSYILASGAFDINSKWKWGFSAERVSDDLLFDRYDIQGVYEQRGLYQTDTRRLLSQVYAVREDQNSYLTISALNFQGLRQFDLNSGMPVVAPLIEARYEPDQAILGGRLRFTGSGVVLSRETDLTDASVPGVDSRRATAEVDWRRAFTLTNGMRVEPFGSGRFDLYQVADENGSTDTHTTGRTIGTAGVDVSWPFIKQTGDTSIILEPLVEGAVSPKAAPNPDIPNEDSIDFVFDETNLFDPNRSPGFDIYDSGARLNVGGRATVDWGDGRSARVLVGRSFRSSPDLLIPVDSGYTERQSDWIIAASAAPVRGLTLYGRTELDPDSFEIRRVEAGADVSLGFVRGYARYLHDNTDPTGELDDIEAAGDVFVTKHWGLVLYGMRDLQKDIWTRRDIGVLYQDECTRIELVYHHEAAFARLGGPSNSIQLRLTLATLGDQGYRKADQR